MDAIDYSVRLKNGKNGKNGENMPEPNNIIAELNNFLNGKEETLSLTGVEVEDIVDTLTDMQDEVAMAEDNASYLETENESLADEITMLRDELDQIRESLEGL